VETLPIHDYLPPLSNLSGWDPDFYVGAGGNIEDEAAEAELITAATVGAGTHDPLRSGPTEHVIGLPPPMPPSPPGKPAAAARK